MKNFIVASALLVAATSANVLGFDLGHTFFKMTLVKPGTPFSIVENTTSKRKTDTMMTITPEQRLWSADSFNSASRYPKTTFANVASYLGQAFNQEELDASKAEWFVLNDFVSDERGMVAWQSFSIEGKEEQTIYYTEELLAMVFKYGRSLSEIQSEGATVKDAVITIPSYFDQQQRRMVMDAADLAGLYVIQLVHENVAAATMFAIDRLDTEKDVNVLFYNMGGVDTEVTIARFSAITDEKNKQFEHVEILAEAYDAHLGGNDFDLVIVNMMVEAFNAMPERKGKADVRENERAMKRLFKESSKVKDILSANKVADVKVPELVDYVTLRTLLQRTDFDQRSEHLLSRVSLPVKEVLEKSGLTLEDIDQVEILGGGLRVPRVHELIKLATNKHELMVHLNGDEAMCFGSAFIASNSSSSFKVRKVFLTQHPSFEYRLEISPLEEILADLEEDSEITYKKDFTLFKSTDYLGAKKTIALSYDRNMKITVFAVSADGSEQALAEYTLDEIDAIVKNDIATKEGSTTPKLTLQFELTRSHLLQIIKSELKIEELVREEIKPDTIDIKEETKEEKETDDTDGEVEAEAEAEKAQEEPEVVEPVFEEKMVPHTYPIATNENLIGVSLLSKDAKKEAKNRIKALEKRDNDKFKTDEAKNTFESLIYEFRSWLNEDENQVYEEASQIEALVDKCNSGEDWLYEAGAEVSFKEY